MRVRIGIVTHNRADILPQAIESALSQSYADKEVWVIDDASTDATSDLADRFPNVTWRRYDSPLGYRHARNEMMKAPGADLFCSLDDDSWFLGEDEVQIGVDFLKDHPNTAAVGFDIIDPGSPEPRGRGPSEPAHTFIGCGHLLRLDAVKQCGYYAETPGAYGVEEKDLSIQLLSKDFDVARLPGVHVWHDKTMESRDVASQHRSGVGNDLAFALRRCPTAQLPLVLPAKLLNHLGFAFRFGLRNDDSRDPFDRSVVEQIGRWGFFRPSLAGIGDFVQNIADTAESREPVKPEAWEQYTSRSRRPMPWLPDSEPKTVGISITTHNRKSDLESTLIALGKLDPQPNEFVVCCDRCTDGTLEMLRENHPNIVVLENDELRGSIPSRDEILRRAKSDIVLSLDDDSYPIELDIVSRLLEIFSKDPRVAVITFPQVTDEFPETLTQIRPQEGAAATVGSFTNSGAAIRREIYHRLPGYPHPFEHAYEEPDYALQCIAAGYIVLFEPALRIRHHYSRQARNELRTHQFHARNEVWSALIRCPLPLLPFVLIYRIWRQFTYALGRGPDWVTKEPAWWRDVLAGLPQILSLRTPVSLRPYWRWMNLIREPERLGGVTRSTEKPLV